MGTHCHHYANCEESLVSVSVSIYISLPVPIIDHSLLVVKSASNVRKELMNVSLYRSAKKTGVSICCHSLKNIASAAVPGMFCPFYLRFERWDVVDLNSCCFFYDPAFRIFF